MRDDASASGSVRPERRAARRRRPSRSGPPSRAARAGAALLGAALATVGCATAPVDPKLETEAAGRDPDRLLVVDCLLPGQLRRLGRSITFVTPRRPTRVNASECEIRGGEYVAYDRADFASSLKVWLPRAEEGDPEAQTFVGEIFEKGLGQAADPAIAAEWYRRAADQGFSRALINLGYLHESGLGVERDLPRAMNLYRRAAGFDDGTLEYVSSVEFAERAQREAELPLLRERAARADAELLVERRAFAALEDDYRALEREAEAARAEIAERAARARVDVPAGSAVATAADPARDAAGSVAADEARIGRLIAEIDALEAALEAADGERERLVGELETQRLRTGELRRDVSGTTAELRAARVELDARASRVAGLEAELAALADRRAGDADAADGRARALAAQLAEAVAARDTLAGHIARIGAGIAARDDATDERLAAAEARERALLAELERSRETLRATREALDAKGASYRERIDALGSSEGALRARLERLAALETELERRRVEVEDRRESLGALESEVSSEQAAGAGPAVERVPEVVAEGPVIEIVDPPVAVRHDGLAIPVAAGERSVDVVGRVSPAAGIVSLRIDGEPAELDGHGVFRHPVPLGASSSLALVAIDEAGRRTAVELELLPESGAARPVSVDVSGLDFGRYHALVIGNSDYESMPDVETSEADATAVARVLERRYGFSAELLLDADRYDMLAALNRKRDELGADDNLLIFYAGRSQSGGGRGHWLPIDADPADRRTWVSDVALTGLIDSMDAKHVMIVADSVFPATLSRASIPRLGETMDADQRLRLYELAASSRVRTVLVSGARAPVPSRADREGRSVFGASVLEALERADGDVVMAQDLFFGIRERLSREDDSSASLGTPNYAPMRHAGHENGEFLFVPTDGPVGALGVPGALRPIRDAP